MKALLITILIGFFVSNLTGQISFSNIDVKFKTVKSNNSTELICSNSTMSIKFQLKHNITVMQQENFVTIDGQTIQITPLKISGYKKGFTSLSINEQKQILDSYSKYELDYFKNELNVEIINPNSQWVMTKSRVWVVWYFRVGNLSTELNKKTKIQLFSSTIIGDKVLTINAPQSDDSDFKNASLIVNEMMESLRTNIKK